MIIDFTCNDESIQIDTIPNKRSSLLLYELGLESLEHAHCRSGQCCNCLIILNNELVPSCLIPAFTLRNQDVITYEGIQKTEKYALVVSAFEDNNYTPCEICNASKTIIAYSILDNKILNEDIPKRFFRYYLCECTDIRKYLSALNNITKMRKGHV